MSHVKDEVSSGQPGGDGQEAGGYTGLGRSLAGDTSLGLSDV